ncbi:MAG TPA: hypothetical protein VEX86_00030 [Longimicrobium sp.]|nr:hypothetical protein [Longimicrobium sp.]
MTDRIQSWVDAGWLSHVPAADEEVTGLWNKSVAALADARPEVMSADARLIRAYDAGRIAATAVVRCHGLRVRAQNHHEMILKSAALLGSPELAQALNEFDRVRHMRTEVEYGWQEVQVDDDRLVRALRLVQRILEMVAAELKACRPHVAAHVQPPD